MRSAIALIAVLLALAGCTAPGQLEKAALPAASLEGAWILTSAMDASGGLDLTNGVPTLTNTDGAWSGTSPCNSFGARAEFGSAPAGQPMKASFARELTTEVYCDQEEPYIAALESVDSAVLTDELTLTGPDIELVYARLVPVDEAKLVDIRWQLRSSETEGSRFESNEAWVEFDANGTARGNSGCRDFSGDWTVGGSVVYFSAFGMGSDRKCSADQLRVEHDVITVLGDGFRAELDSLDTPSGRSLVATAHRSDGQLVFEPAEVG